LYRLEGRQKDCQHREVKGTFQQHTGLTYLQQVARKDWVFLKVLLTTQCSLQQFTQSSKQGSQKSYGNNKVQAIN
jgi:hypothetical protein